MEEIVKMPMVALRRMTILPHTTVHFDISRSVSMEAVKLAMATNQFLFVVTQKDENQRTELAVEELYTVGTIVKIKQMIKMPQNIVRVLVQATSRAYLKSISLEENYYLAQLTKFISEDQLSENEEIACNSELLEKLQQCILNGMKCNQAVLKKFNKQMKTAQLLDEIADHIPLEYQSKQKLLQEEDIYVRVQLLLLILENEANVYRIRNDLQDKLKGCVEKNQKEYVLREQLKLIREELGEDNVESEGDTYYQRLMQLEIPDEVRKKLEKEIKRFKGMNASSSETTVLRTYIDTLLEYPWNQATEDSKDIRRAMEILEEDHYGLKKVKERIVDFLAVRLLNEQGDSPIICLVGPPGTGKTSVAKSIARAIGKRYIRISLGGVKDEAEIRGHRKTYIGAMPGRIATAIAEVGANNPLILLDEIDKLGNDYKGDPASALLEVLDSAQNTHFIDHYYEVPIDLSHVLFVTTANDASQIPRPLLDRMEVIEVSSYTENEKYHIADQYLIEKQRIKNGLRKSQFKISQEAIYEIVRDYTREAGVRNLERQISKLCRKAAKAIVTGERKSLSVTHKNLEPLLGFPTYKKDREQLISQIGTVTGLAWTSVGGDTLSVEVNVMPGTGKVELTGQLGDVMKESARLAITYVRSTISTLKEDYFEHHDIHIHVPEGAVPKDGPSAGVTMVTAVYSAITQIAVRGDIAMTGEITLRGRVLPIGGLKEKLLAARNHGIKEVLVPDYNKRNIQEIESEIMEGLTITYVSSVDEVLSRALIKE